MKENEFNCPVAIILQVKTASCQTAVPSSLLAQGGKGFFQGSEETQFTTKLHQRVSADRKCPVVFTNHYYPNFIRITLLVWPGVRFSDTEDLDFWFLLKL